jgi:hypothetical protein
VRDIRLPDPANRDRRRRDALVFGEITLAAKNALRRLTANMAAPIPPAAPATNAVMGSGLLLVQHPVRDHACGRDGGR